MIQVARMDNHHASLHNLSFDNEPFQLSGEYEDLLHGNKRKKKTDDWLPEVEHIKQEVDDYLNVFDILCSSETDSASWFASDNGFSSPNEDADNLLRDDLFPSVKTPEAQLEEFTGLSVSPVAHMNGHDSVILKEVSMSRELNKPYRIRKKSVSQTLAWYQGSRKRKMSFSACSPSRARNSSLSESIFIKCEMSLLNTADGRTESNESAGVNVDSFSLNQNGMEDFVTLPTDSNVHIKDEMSDLHAVDSCVMEAELADMIPDGYAIHNIDGFLWDNDISKLFDEEDYGNLDSMQTKQRKLDLENKSVGTNIFSDIFADLNVDQGQGSCANASSLAQPADCSSNLYTPAESVHRRPGRPRKKSISQSVAWYRSHRRRQASMSSTSTASHPHELCDSNQAYYQRRLSARIATRHVDGRKHTTGLKPVKRSRGGRKPKTAPSKKWLQATPTDDRTFNMWEHSSNDSGYDVDYTSTTTMSCESDDDDAIVDVVTVSTSVNERSNDAFSPVNLKAMIGLVNAWHCYCSPMNLATQRALAKASNRETKFKLVLSPERRGSVASTIDCATPASRPLASNRKNRSRRREARDRVTDEQRIKREALNDLERNRRREMTRELTALRVVVPGVRDNSRAPKVTILDSATQHIRFLERQLARNETVLAELHQKMAELKALR